MKNRRVSVGVTSYLRNQTNIMSSPGEAKNLFRGRRRGTSYVPMTSRHTFSESEVS